MRVSDLLSVFIGLAGSSYIHVGTSFAAFQLAVHCRVRKFAQRVPQRHRLIRLGRECVLFKQIPMDDADRKVVATFCSCRPALVPEDPFCLRNRIDVDSFPAAILRGRYRASAF